MVVKKLFESIDMADSPAQESNKGSAEISQE